MCDKAVDTFLFVFDSVSDQYLSKEPIMLKYYPDKYETQEMCDKAVDYLLTLKRLPDWFVTSKMFEKFDILFFLITMHFFARIIVIMMIKEETNWGKNHKKWIDKNRGSACLWNDSIVIINYVSICKMNHI